MPSKRPAVKVAGPYGHPFHPVLVTLPIGAFVSSFLFDVAARLGWLSTIPDRTPASNTAVVHGTVNLPTGLFGFSAGVRPVQGLGTVPQLAFRRGTAGVGFQLDSALLNGCTVTPRW